MSINLNTHLDKLPRNKLGQGKDEQSVLSLPYIVYVCLPQ